MAIENRPHAREATPPRVLVAVHGHEPTGWVAEAVRAVPRPAELRIVAVLDAPVPAFTSLLPAACRRHAAAVADQQRIERGRMSAGLSALLGALGAAHRPDVQELNAADGDPGRAIAEQAAAWPADLVVVGRDVRPRASRLVLGAVHERVLRCASCTVVVVGRDARKVAARVPAVAPPRLQAGA